MIMHNLLEGPKKRAWAKPTPAVVIPSLIFLLGLWLVLSPFVLGYAGIVGAAWNDLVMGILINVSAYSYLRQPRSSLITVQILVGGWLILSPWFFGTAYGTQFSAAINEWVVGFVMIALATAGIQSNGWAKRTVG